MAVDEAQLTTLLAGVLVRMLGKDDRNDVIPLTDNTVLVVQRGAGYLLVSVNPAKVEVPT